MRSRVIRAAVWLIIASVALVAAGEEKSRLMTVTIVALDAKAMTMTVSNEVKGADAEQLKLVIEPGATVRIHGLKGKLDQLKAGDVVTVRYSVREGKHLVSEIQHM